MARNDRDNIKPIFGVLFWLLTTNLTYATENDVTCLRFLKDSLRDPLNFLSSWNFTNNNTTEGNICRFTGIDCWHIDDNRVLNIKLSGMSLTGEFPQALSYCTSLTGLDLSDNNFTGPIPSNISRILPFITTLDLSSNHFSGEIPVNLVNCSFLNELNLDSNRLSGQIPLELGRLNRIKTFSVANNRLTGQVPTFANLTVTTESFANNPGLCGAPLRRCQGLVKKSNSGIIIGAGVGGSAFAVLVVGIAMVFFMRRKAKRKKDDDPKGNKWARNIIKGAKNIKLSTFETTYSKMRLRDLMKATNEFSKDNIILSGSTGTTYKAELEDGTTFMVKRLQDTQHSETEFNTEMSILGTIKQRNLVPLLGFCIAKKEKLLIYKYMPNGTLHDKLHPSTENPVLLDWPHRLKIAIGAAKGFAFLHHTCNPRIIHRNISSKSILLNADYDARISDFGLARLMNPVDTHLSTFVKGEFGDLGYVAPEYARTLVATPKGDVYSYGVVLLELVTGEEPTRVVRAGEGFKGNLVDWITQLSKESNLQSCIDEFLVCKGVKNEIFQLLKVACNCVLPSSHKERPTMFEVYQLLRSIGERYCFTADDDDLVPEIGNREHLVELIVSREAKNYK
jgi:serine/threonine protein kinase